tara:strand:- start:34978 stop:35505 length:528 start_codon:yes stop_codon:yes gene_type:complete
MFYRVINRSESTVVTLGQAKNQLNIIDGEDEGLDDDHIQLLVDTAVELSEKYTRRLFTVETVELLVQNKRSFFLPLGEVETVTSAKLVNGDSDVEFTFSPISQILTFADDADITSEIKITYNAGYAKPARAAILGSMMLLSSMWENREDTITGMTVADIPLNSTAILDSIKLGWF